MPKVRKLNRKRRSVLMARMKAWVGLGGWAILHLTDNTGLRLCLGCFFFTFLVCERVAELNFLVVLKVCKNEAKRLVTEF